MFKNVLVVIVLLFLASGCIPEKFGQERIDQLCPPDRCYTATVLEGAEFEPDQHAGSLKQHCGMVYGEPVPSGLVVHVAAVMPDDFYHNAALVGWVDEVGVAHVGWIDADFLGNWSPREMIGLLGHCSTP